jgi:hypothetical protein
MLRQIKTSPFFTELDKLARMSIPDRREHLGVREETPVREVDPRLTDILEDSKRNTLKKYEVKGETVRSIDLTWEDGSLGSSAEPDGRMKWLSKGDAPAHEVVNDQGDREKRFDGIRLNGEVYWVGTIFSPYLSPLIASIGWGRCQDTHQGEARSVSRDFVLNSRPPSLIER